MSHTDLIKHIILRDYSENPDFQKFALSKLVNKDEWCGCFGSLCIIRKTDLLKLNNSVSFIDKFIRVQLIEIDEQMRVFLH